MDDRQRLNIQQGQFTFARQRDFKLESGQKFGPITLVYETYGRLNPARDNAILICHALTGNAHVAGKLPGEKKSTGWWNPVVGAGKPFDTDKFFIICSNILGGCSGSTGPSSLNPRTKKPYGMDFPIITIRDMVNAQRRLVAEHFGLTKLHAVAGGSIGGMQTLEWGVMYPEMVGHLLVISTTHKLSSQAIAFNKIGRHAIMIDPSWKNGRYYNTPGKIRGLGLARMVAHITYLSEEGMQNKFGRERTGHKDLFSFNEKFQVENYLDHQGEKFMQRFDANSYIYLSKAMDLFDLARGYRNLNAAIKRIKGRTLFIYFSSDWLFPEYQSAEMIESFQRNHKYILSYKVESNSGHDAFLVEYDKLSPIMQGFLDAPN
ncbi:homoserine O-acetyltransferase [Candidatus Termititenax persephonae]|uniref:Homoserine O-acetyltransferase n=1 Tax=Candidatus Termititenax persephonae TaxID=2218525 RepID=A0A388TGF3_9BACT|nr:homoserine O-acetyltransferase [Candidatus Termititenax persephonae]